MTREEFLTASEVAFERLLLPLKELPSELMEEPIAEGRRSVKLVLAHLLHWDTVVVQALEALYHGDEFDWKSIGSIQQANENTASRYHDASYKRVHTELRIAHGTVMAAVERIPDEQWGNDGELPQWLPRLVCEHYEHHAPVIEAWAKKIRESGRGGPKGLPVVQ